MHRTQLYLDEPRYQYLLDLARQKKESLAQVVRDLLDEYKKRTVKQPKADPFFKVIGIGKGDGKPVACDYETYLYNGIAR